MKRLLLFVALILCGTTWVAGENLLQNLAKGYEFESPADMGKWNTSGGAKVGLSTEYAFRGKQSLKLEWETPGAAISFSPEITDWRPYKQLRFTLFNPLPVPNKKYRIFLVNRNYLPPNCSIASGFLSVSPESAREFVLDLDTLPESVDRSNITSLHFFKGNPETIFYLDSMKLYTAEEVEVLTVGRAKKEVEFALSMLNQAKDAATGELKAKIDAGIADMQKLGASASLSYNDELVGKITSVKELAVLVLSSTGEEGPLVLQGIPATEKIFRDTCFTGGKTVFTLSAAGNERESFQVVALPLKDLKNVEVSATPLKSSNGNIISAANIKINPVGYIEVEDSFAYNSSRLGFWPDILVHNQKLDLSGRLQPYWITVYVSPDCNAGLYKGEICFTAEGGISKKYPYEIQVHNFSLPTTGKLLTFFDWRYNSSNPVIRRKCYDIMLDHRLSPTSMYTNGNSPDSENAYRFSPHPDDIEYCLSRGMNILNIWYLYDGSSETPHEFSEEYLAKIKKLINYYKPILEQKGAWDIAMINGFDEIMHQPKETVAKRLGEARKICTWLKEDYPELRISNVGKKMDISTDLMDVWFMGVKAKEETQDITEKGGKVCFYWVNGNPSPMLDLPGMACRILSWQAFKEEAKGIGYYSTYRSLLKNPHEKVPTGVDWPKEIVKIAGQRGDNGCGRLFYPDRDGAVLASTRLANVRDGVEDYEYLALLNELDPTHPLLTIPDEIVTLGNDCYTKDFKTIETYRRQIANAIENAIKNK